MSSTSKVRRSGSKVCVVPVEAWLDVLDTCDAFRGLTLSPANYGKLVLNGTKAILQLDIKTVLQNIAPFMLKGIQDIDGNMSIQVVPSTVGGQLPKNMNGVGNPPYVIKDIGGSGLVYVTVSHNDDELESVSIDHGDSLPEDEDGSASFALGYYSVIEGSLNVHNVAYGPVTVTFCRDWFVDPPKYTINFGAAAVNSITVQMQLPPE